MGWRRIDLAGVRRLHICTDLALVSIGWLGAWASRDALGGVLERPLNPSDAYLAALDRFGAPQQEALALEDSARGLEAARRAGLDCLVIRSPFTASQDFGAAWRVVDSIREVPALLAA